LACKGKKEKRRGKDNLLNDVHGREKDITQKGRRD